MKKQKLIVIMLIISAVAFFPSCDSGGSGGGGSEARALGNELVLSGTVTQTFLTYSHELSPGYTNASSYNFRLLDESDNTLYFTDDNSGADVNVDINYTGTIHLDHLYSSAVWEGITSSNSSAQLTSAVIDVDTTSNDIVNGNFDSVPPAKWYYYMYSSADTTLDGTYVDVDDKTYTYEDLKLFAGWNELICETSDGSAFEYYGGTISNPKWTYMNNEEP